MLNKENNKNISLNFVEPLANEKLIRDNKMGIQSYGFNGFLLDESQIISVTNIFPTNDLYLSVSYPLGSMTTETKLEIISKSNISGFKKIYLSINSIALKSRNLNYINNEFKKIIDLINSKSELIIEIFPDILTLPELKALIECMLDNEIKTLKLNNLYYFDVYKSFIKKIFGNNISLEIYLNSCEDNSNSLEKLIYDYPFNNIFIDLSLFLKSINI